MYADLPSLLTTSYPTKGRGGAHESDYNMTIYNHLLAELRGLAAGVRRAAASSPPLVNINRRGDGGTNSSARTDGTGSGVQIGVNTGGWIHFKFLQMLIADKHVGNHISTAAIWIMLGGLTPSRRGGKERCLYADVRSTMTPPRSLPGLTLI